MSGGRCLKKVVADSARSPPLTSSTHLGIKQGDETREGECEARLLVCSRLLIALVIPAMGSFHLDGNHPEALVAHTYSSLRSDPRTLEGDGCVPRDISRVLLCCCVRRGGRVWLGDRRLKGAGV